MTRLDHHDGKAILAVSKDRPEQLFPHDEDLAVKLKRTLVGIWQPRLAGDDPAVMAHINFLWDQREVKLKAGTWEGEGVLRLVDSRKAESSFPYKVYRPFELGGTYIAPSLVGHLIAPQHNALSQNALKHMKSFTFKDEKLRSEASRYLPLLVSDFISLEGRLIVVKKDPDLISLRDVLSYFDGQVPPRQVAWMLSCLYALGCYLRISRLTHNAISLDNYYVNANHSGALLGGWWYAAHFGEKLTVVPARTHTFMPAFVKTEKVADPTVDMELIKACGRELLGDLHGSRLLSRKDVPAPLVQWLRQPASSNAHQEYDAWYNQVLPASFGPRRFVKLDINASDIY